MGRSLTKCTGPSVGPEKKRSLGQTSGSELRTRAFQGDSALQTLVGFFRTRNDENFLLLIYTSKGCVGYWIKKSAPSLPQKPCKEWLQSSSQTPILWQTPEYCRSLPLCDLPREKDKSTLLRTVCKGSAVPHIMWDRR